MLSEVLTIEIFQLHCTNCMNVYSTCLYVSVRPIPAQGAGVSSSESGVNSDFGSKDTTPFLNNCT